MKEFSWFLWGISPFSWLYSIYTWLTRGEKSSASEGWTMLLKTLGYVILISVAALSLGIFATVTPTAAVFIFFALAAVINLAARLIMKSAALFSSLKYYLTAGSLTKEQSEQLANDLGYIFFGQNRKKIIEDHTQDALLLYDGEDQATADISDKFTTAPKVDLQFLWSEIIVPLIIAGFCVMVGFALFGGSSFDVNGVGGLAVIGQILMTGALANPIFVFCLAGVALAFITQWVIRKFNFSPADDSPTKAVESAVKALDIFKRAAARHAADEEVNLLPHEVDALIAHYHTIEKLQQAGVLKFVHNDPLGIPINPNDIHLSLLANDDDDNLEDDGFFSVYDHKRKGDNPGRERDISSLADQYQIREPKLLLTDINSTWVQNPANHQRLQNCFKQFTGETDDALQADIDPDLRQNYKTSRRVSDDIRHELKAKEKIRVRENRLTTLLAVLFLAFATWLVYAIFAGIIAYSGLIWALPLAAGFSFLSVVLAKKRLTHSSSGHYTELTMLTGVAAVVLTTLAISALHLFFSPAATGFVLSTGAALIVGALAIFMSVLTALFAWRAKKYSNATAEQRALERQGKWYKYTKNFLRVVKLLLMFAALTLFFASMAAMFNLSFFGIGASVTHYAFAIAMQIIPNNHLLATNMLSVFSIFTASASLAMAVMMFRSLLRDFHPTSETDYRLWKRRLDIISAWFKLTLTVSLPIALWFILPPLGGIFASTGLLPMMFVISFALPLLTGNANFTWLGEERGNALKAFWDGWFGVAPFYKSSADKEAWSFGGRIQSSVARLALRETVMSGGVLLLPATIVLLAVGGPVSWFYFAATVTAVFFRLQRILSEALREEPTIVIDGTIYIKSQQGVVVQRDNVDTLSHSANAALYGYGTLTDRLESVPPSSSAAIVTHGTTGTHIAPIHGQYKEGKAVVKDPKVRLILMSENIEPSTAEIKQPQDQKALRTPEKQRELLKGLLVRKLGERLDTLDYRICKLQNSLGNTPADIRRKCKLGEALAFIRAINPKRRAIVNSIVDKVIYRFRSSKKTVHSFTDRMVAGEAGHKYKSNHQPTDDSSLLVDFDPVGYVTNLSLQQLLFHPQFMHAHGLAGVRKIADGIALNDRLLQEIDDTLADAGLTPDGATVPPYTESAEIPPQEHEIPARDSRYVFIADPAYRKRQEVAEHPVARGDVQLPVEAPPASLGTITNSSEHSRSHSLASTGSAAPTLVAM